MLKICIFTGIRAEYGLLKCLIDEILKDSSITLQIIASGTHLSPEFGLTYKQIESDGIKIDEKIEILISSDSSIGICKSTGLGLISFSEALDRLKPDILAVLGDRFETLSIVLCALFLKIPVAHIHGGEITQGAIDDSIRHAITKMSHIHFASTEIYRKRIIQLGEMSENVFNVGALGVENFKKIKLLGRNDFEKAINFTLGEKNLLITFHPSTLSNETAQSQFQNILDALKQFSDMKIIFTKANSDSQGRTINKMIDAYVSQNQNFSIAFTSMGQILYLSAIKHVDAVVGNSSSGIIEAPCAKTPTVNIGDRQKGRIKAKSVLDCKPYKEEIFMTIQKAVSYEFKKSIQDMINPYEKENTANTIKNILKSINLDGIIVKRFNDI